MDYVTKYIKKMTDALGHFFYYNFLEKYST